MFMQTMRDAIDILQQALKVATTSRKKGDAWRRAGRDEGAVLAVYDVGAAALQGGIEVVVPARQQLESMTPPLTGDAALCLDEMVESIGALGGLRQRMAQFEQALASYAAGGALEERFALPDTYNRLNAIKLRLLTGPASLQELQAEIKALADLIEAALRASQALSDKGWAWADLGDCLGLLGRTEESARAYATFIAKAEIKSPERALDVLKQIAAALQARADPQIARLQSAIHALQGRLPSP